MGLGLSREQRQSLRQENRDRLQAEREQRQEERQEARDERQEARDERQAERQEARQGGSQPQSPLVGSYRQLAISDDDVLQAVVATGAVTEEQAIAARAILADPAASEQAKQDVAEWLNSVAIEADEPPAETGVEEFLMPENFGTKDVVMILLLALVFFQVLKRLKLKL